MSGIPKTTLTRKEFWAQVHLILQDAEKNKGGYRNAVRELSKESLFFLCVFVLGMDYIDNDFAYNFCCEIDRKCYGRIWICAREHFKSTLLTKAHTIQEIIRNPEECICIYSYNDSIAKAFLNDIKTTIEGSDLLKAYFDDIFWENPSKECMRLGLKWNADGLTVKRKSVRKEPTVGCSGLVTGQETGMHYTIGVYDDCVTPDSVKTPDMITTTIKQWEMSLNTLSSQNLRYVVIGTFYHFQELYNHIIDNKICEPIVQPCRDKDGKPVLYSEEALQMKQKTMGSSVWASQMMCDPREARKDTFSMSWIRRWDAQTWNNLNIYCFVDPSGKVSRKRDYTAVWVIGYAPDGNYMVIDMWRDKLNLSQRTNLMFTIARNYKPKMFFYEEFGMQSDIVHIREAMDGNNYRFAITPVKNTTEKGLRIESLQPELEGQKLYFPMKCLHTNWEGHPEDMLDTFFREECQNYPFIIHDDALDSLAMICDPTVKRNVLFPQMDINEQRYKPNKKKFGKNEEYDPLWDCL